MLAHQTIYDQLSPIGSPLSMQQHLTQSALQIMVMLAAMHTPAREVYTCSSGLLAVFHPGAE